MSKQDPIAWSEILGQCDNYRNGFVAVFRKYEGLPTDELTAQNKVVKVTAGSFAAHVGIHPDTFRRWIKAVEVSSSAQPSSRSKKALTRDVKRAARHEPDAVVAGIMDAPESVQDAIFDELKLRRAGVDTSTAHRKSVEAHVHAATEPIHRALATTELVLCESALREAAEHLQHAISADACTEETMAPVVAAYEAVAIAMAEARMLIS